MSRHRHRGEHIGAGRSVRRRQQSASHPPLRARPQSAALDRLLGGRHWSELSITTRKQIIALLERHDLSDREVADHIRILAGAPTQAQAIAARLRRTERRES